VQARTFTGREFGESVEKSLGRLGVAGLQGPDARAAVAAARDADAAQLVFPAKNHTEALREFEPCAQDDSAIQACIFGVVGNDFIDF
jgi:hypothetical protein